MRVDSHNPTVLYGLTSSGITQKGDDKGQKETIWKHLTGLARPVVYYIIVWLNWLEINTNHCSYYKRFLLMGQYVPG